MLASAAQSSSPAASLSVLGAIIAGLRTKFPIGGWLFFFLWGAFAGLGVTLLAEFGDRRPYLFPATWKDQTKYLFYLLSLGPRVCSLCLVIAFSVVLIRSREWRWIQMLQSALAAFVISQLATVVIDAYVFPSALNVAIAGLFYPIAFLLYTLSSKRVARVFQKHDWQASQARPVRQ